MGQFIEMWWFVKEMTICKETMCIKEEEDKQSQEEDQTNICKLSLSLIINFVWKCVKLIHHSVIASYIYSMAIALNDLVDNHDIFFSTEGFEDFDHFHDFVSWLVYVIYKVLCALYEMEKEKYR